MQTVEVIYAAYLAAEKGRRVELRKRNLDGLGKSPSAALRFNFLVAAPKGHFPPQFLRALHLELFTKPSFRHFFGIINLDAF